MDSDGLRWAPALGSSSSGSQQDEALVQGEVGCHSWHHRRDICLVRGEQAA